MAAKKKNAAKSQSRNADVRYRVIARGHGTGITVVQPGGKPDLRYEHGDEFPASDWKNISKDSLRLAEESGRIERIDGGDE